MKIKRDAEKRPRSHSVDCPRHLRCDGIYISRVVDGQCGHTPRCWGIDIRHSTRALELRTAAVEFIPTSHLRDNLYVCIALQQEASPIAFSLSLPPSRARTAGKEKRRCGAEKKLSQARGKSLGGVKEEEEKKKRECRGERTNLAVFLIPFDIRTNPNCATFIRIFYEAL